MNLETIKVPPEFKEIEGLIRVAKAAKAIDAYMKDWQSRATEEDPRELSAEGLALRVALEKLEEL